MRASGIAALQPAVILLHPVEVEHEAGRRRRGIAQKGGDLRGHRATLPESRRTAPCRGRPQVDETVERTSDQRGPPGLRRTGLPERLTSLRKPCAAVTRSVCASGGARRVPWAWGQRHVRTASGAHICPPRRDAKEKCGRGRNFFQRPARRPETPLRSARGTPAERRVEVRFRRETTCRRVAGDRGAGRGHTNKSAVSTRGVDLDGHLRAVREAEAPRPPGCRSPCRAPGPGRHPVRVARRSSAVGRAFARSRGWTARRTGPGTPATDTNCATSSAWESPASRAAVQVAKPPASGVRSSTAT